MKIVVLCGGISKERNVSIRSGNLVYESLKEREHDVILLDICENIENITEDIFKDVTKYGKWEDENIPQEAPKKEELDNIKNRLQGNIFGKNVLAVCKKADIVFLALHGADGENGNVQKILSDERVPYTGSNSSGSRNAMDKAITKELLKADGRVKVPFGEVLKADELSSLKYDIQNLKFPLVIKPCNGGSSVGVSILNNTIDYNNIVKEGLVEDKEYILEEYIKGREFSVGILAGKALPVIEIIPKQGFYNYKNKYEAGLTEEICPANIDENTNGKMQEAAEIVHKVLGLDVYSRVDFILSDSGELYCLEANTLPGMTPTSLLPQEANAVGLTHADLCEKIIELSLKKEN